MDYGLNRTNKIIYDYTEYEPFEDEQVSDDMVFYNSEVYVRAYDLDDNVLMKSSMDIPEFEKNFGKEVTRILREKIDNGEYDGEIEDILFFEDSNISTDDVEAVNDRARIFFSTTTEYYKGMRGYILTDGDILEFGENRDHNGVNYITDDMTVGKFVSLGNIRIGNQSFELEKRPTRQQMSVLSRLIRAYSDDVLYVDISKYSEGHSYSSVIIGKKYIHPRADMVLYELERYFDEGVVPNGATVAESVSRINYVIDEVLNESKDVITVNESSIMDYLFKGCTTFEDYKKRVITIAKVGVVSIGVLFGAISYISTLNEREKKELQHELVSIDEPQEEVDNTLYAEDFRASEDGKAHIKSYETLQLEPYYATPYEERRGILTVGYGHKVTDKEKGKYKLGVPISEEEADRLFNNDLWIAERYVKHLITRGNVNHGLQEASVYPQGLMDAMISMMFSGYGNFRDSMFYKRLCNCRKDAETGKIEKSDYDYTVAAIPNSITKQGGKELGGLKRRRQAEYNMAVQ